MARNQFGGFGGPNMQQLMRQAQKMQEQMQKAQEELDAKVYEASAGGGMVSVTVTGKRELKVLEIKPEAAVMIVSTMTPHSGSNWDHVAIQQQEKQLLTLAKQYRKDEKNVAVACVNSVSVAVQEHKTFNDYSGNNINHPNDWFYRVYAQTLLQTLIGYENMN